MPFAVRAEKEGDLLILALSGELDSKTAPELDREVGKALGKSGRALLFDLTDLEFVASAVRASGVEPNNPQAMIQALRQLGMPLYMCQPPTGYSDRADAWVNTGALLNRMNFALMVSRGVTPQTADGIVDAVLAGDLSESTRKTVARAESDPQKVALLLGSPDFQKR